MIAAVIDVGSNTARLLVADVDGRRLQEVRRDRRYLRLGDDVHERGAISAEKLAETADVARRFARTARRAGAERLETIVTAPGRQAANGAELVERLAAATGAAVTLLSGDDEGRLAWEGAVAGLEQPSDVVTVIDLGGGSCEVAVGAPEIGPSRVRSFDAGALLVTRTYLCDEPSSPGGVLAARRALRATFGTLEPATGAQALVVGGTARAIARVIGSRFDAEQLEGLASSLERIPLDAIATSHGITRERAETLLGGALVLLELAHRLDAELRVVRGGVREGAVLLLARTLLAAA